MCWCPPKALHASLASMLPFAPNRVGWTHASGRVHTRTFAMWGAGITFCGVPVLL